MGVDRLVAALTGEEEECGALTESDALGVAAARTVGCG
jgi:hypothetical protein